jgi:hypothetical protein
VAPAKAAAAAAAETRWWLHWSSSELGSSSPCRAELTSFHSTWPERCGELTWVVLERRRYQNMALDDTASALGDGGGRL